MDFNLISYTVFSFMLGAIFASFFYAWALRLGKKNTSITSPSRCLVCDKRLGPLELVPIFSWIFQRGRCGCKKYGLDRGYVICEVVLASIFGLLAYYLPWLDAVFFQLLSALLIFFFLTDYFYQLLYVPMMIFCGLMGIVYSINNGSLFNEGILGLLTGFIVIFLINGIYKLIKKSDGFGSGDKYLVGAIGAWIGPIKVIYLLFIASWIGTLFSIYLIYKRKVTLKSALPFGIFLTLSVPLTYLF